MGGYGALQISRLSRLGNPEWPDRTDRGSELSQQVAPDIRFLAQKGTYEYHLAGNDGEARVWIGVTCDSKKTVLYRRYFLLNPASLLFASSTSGRPAI